MDIPHHHEAERRTSREDFVQLKAEVHHLSWRIEQLEEAIGKLVTQIEFSPIKLTVYGLVGGILMAVLGAIVALVLQRQ